MKRLLTLITVLSGFNIANAQHQKDTAERRTDSFHRLDDITIISGYIYARFDAASDPAIVLSVGFVLVVAIYVQTAILYGVYTPELFPTEIRLRANGICNFFGRGATVVSPFIVGSLMASYKLPGVVWLMIALVVVQILVVWAWGVEPRNRGLEDVAAKA